MVTSTIMTATVDPDRLVGGRYALEKLIGEGGTGEVWRARHVTLRSPVAIKLLHGSAAFKESTRKRFLTEARVAAQLSTRHAVKVFDFGVTEQGRPYLIMELLDGETLAHRLEREHVLSPYATARILRLASRALDAAHALGVVHRDFKPENIFLVRTEEEEEEDVKVVDFGVAKLVGGLDDPDVEDTAPVSTRQLERSFTGFTRTGRSVGTPCYMAPEQAKPHAEVGPAADVWAVGVVAYECLTGTRPFFAQDIPSLFDRIEHCTYTPAKERNPALPDAFDEWFRRTCAPDPRKRFPNASAATLALIDVLEIQSTITMGDPESSHAVLLRGPQSLPTPRLPRELSLTPGASSTPETSERRRSHKPAMLGVAAVLALGVVAGAWLHLQAPSTPTTPSATSEPSMTATDAALAQNPVVEAAIAAASASASSAPPPSATPTATTTTTAPRTKPSADATGGKVRVDGPATGDPVPPPAKEATKPPETSPPRTTTPASPFELPDLGL